MKIFSRDNPARPLIIVCLSYGIIGYVLFFVSCILPTPSWGPSLMAWCAPVIKSIDTAARVGLLKGNDPFPIQVVILYCVLFGITVIPSYFVYISYINKHNRLLGFKHAEMLIREQGWSTYKFFWNGLFGIMMGLWLLYVAFFMEESNASIDGWRTIKTYSSTIFSVSILLIGSFISLFPIMGIGSIYLAFFKRIRSIYK